MTVETQTQANKHSQLELDRTAYFWLLLS